MALARGSRGNINGGQAKFEDSTEKARLDFAHDSYSHYPMNSCSRGREVFLLDIVLRTYKYGLYSVLVEVVVQPLVDMVEKIAFIGQFERRPQDVADGFGTFRAPDGIHSHAPRGVTVADSVIPYTVMSGFGNSLFSTVQHHGYEGLGIPQLPGNVHLRYALMVLSGHMMG